MRRKKGVFTVTPLILSKKSDCKLCSTFSKSIHVFEKNKIKTDDRTSKVQKIQSSQRQSLFFLIDTKIYVGEG